jgi:PadR family transcriptional regulator
VSSALGEFEQLVLLAVLRLKGDGYGVTIRRALAERVGRDVAAGAVYTTLSRLEARGFVRSRVGETAPERTGKRRRYYEVEPVGAAALRRSYEDVQVMMEGLLPDLTELASRTGQGSVRGGGR